MRSTITKLRRRGAVQRHTTRRNRHGASRPSRHNPEIMRVSENTHEKRKKRVHVVATAAVSSDDNGWGALDDEDGSGGGDNGGDDGNKRYEAGGDDSESIGGAIDDSSINRNIFVDIARARFLFYNYFNTPGKWFRKYLWWCVSLLFGFYFSNTLSLTFGALGVNDVIAGIVCLIVHEIITKEHYSRTPR